MLRRFRIVIAGFVSLPLIWSIQGCPKTTPPSGMEVQKPTPGLQADPSQTPSGGVMTGGPPQGGQTAPAPGGVAPLPPGKGKR